jgi:hypothetical protein
MLNRHKFHRMIDHCQGYPTLALTDFLRKLIHTLLDGYKRTAITSTLFLFAFVKFLMKFTSI